MAERIDWFTVNRTGLRKILKSPEADDLVLSMAVKACKAANDWAATIKRSGRHKDISGPHFEVQAEKSEFRVRYTVRPCTAFGTWIVQKRPAEFMAALDAARR